MIKFIKNLIKHDSKKIVYYYKKEANNNIMIIDKIKIYLFLEIIKNFTLVLFIFLSVAWLLQITRLFTITNFLHIEIIDIFFLSLYLIPNLITVIVPFILIFALLLCFVKLNRYNELIVIASLGLGLKPFKSSLILFFISIIIIFVSLNVYFAPKVYEIYKLKEFELRNTIDFKKMEFSNFLNLNKTTILDFDKNNNEYEDIFISFNDEKENIVYAKKGNIINENNLYKFILSDGFKISIDKNKQIEKLEFLSYILKIDNKDISKNIIFDKNTLTIIDDYKSKNFLNISFKVVDIFLIIFILLFFYINNLKELNFKSFNNIYFSGSCICILIINQILKNSEITIYNYLFIFISLIISSLIILRFKKKYEKN